MQKFTITILATCSAALVFTGCSKKELSSASVQPTFVTRPSHAPEADRLTAYAGTPSLAAHPVEDKITAEMEVVATPPAVVKKSNLKSPSAIESIPAREAEPNHEKARQDIPQSRRELKKQVKEMAQTSETEINTILLVIIAILLPPVAVLLVDGLSGPFWLSILLTLLLYLPGLIYALFRIFRK